jgi:uncharacterized protein (TIGR03437 family)
MMGNSTKIIGLSLLTTSLLFGGIEGEWSGQIVQTIEDQFGTDVSRSRFVLETASGERLTLDRGTGYEAVRRAGCAAVQIKGSREGNVLHATRISPPASISPLCQPLGEQKVAVLLLQHPTIPLRADFTTQTISQLLFGPGVSLGGYLLEASFGKTSVTGNVFGPFTVDRTLLPGGCSIPDLPRFRDLALKAANGSIDLHAYNSFLLITPHGADCGGIVSAGEAITNCPTFVLPDGSTSNARVAWASSDPTHDFHEILPTIIHEFVHTLGIVNHASSLDFDRNPLGLLGAAGTHDEYGDRFSTMGGGKCVSDRCTHGHLNAEHKLLLGWLDPVNDVLTVSASGNFILAPYENSTGVRALKILRPGTGQWLWLEYRQPIGYDATLDLLNPKVFSGVLIRYDPALGYEGSFYTHLLDFHAAATPNDFANAPLLSGESWLDPYTPLSIAVGPATSAGLQIRVSFDAPCVTVSPANVVQDSPAGSFPVNVQAPSDCGWTATSQAPWASVVTSGNHSGVGSLKVSLSENQGAATRIGLISIGRSLAVGVVQKPGVQLLYSNLGPGDAFDLNAGLGFGGLAQAEGFSLASPFQPSISAPLTRIELFLGVDGRSTDKPAFNVSIMTDSAGRPGDVIETIPVTPNLAFTFTGVNSNTPQYVTVNSVSHPVLSPDNHYWLALSPTNLLNAGNLLIYWSLNSTGATAPVVAGRIGNNGWGSTGTTLTAFRISGTGAPNGYLGAAVNSAGYAGDAIAAGEIVALFGGGLGLDALSIAQPVAGRFPSDPLQGTSVLFDGQPAPLIYVSGSQIAVAVPYAAANRTATQIQVVRDGTSSAPLVMPIAASAPGLFSADSSGLGQGAVLNQDGTLNSSGNPAKVGSIVVLFATGEGQTDPAGTDGLLADTVLPKPALPVTLTIDGQVAEVVYFGAAPKEIAGLMQINARIPAGTHLGSNIAVVLSVGPNQSQSGLTISVQ